MDEGVGLHGMMGRTSRVLIARRLYVSLCVALLSALALAGATRLSYDDDYRGVFKSDHPVYQRYDALRAAFSLDENDFIVIAESESLITAEILPRLREVDWSLREIEAVAAVFSIFNARSLDDQDGYLPPLFPAADASEGAFTRARDAALRHPLLSGVLLSGGAEAALFVVSLGGGERGIETISTSYAEILEILERQSSGALRFSVTGIPALRVEIIKANRRDQVLFLLAGAVLAGLFAFILFRRMAAVVVCGAGPVVGILWTLGAMGTLGEPINVINSIVPVLLLVIGFADSVHLVAHIRHAQERGLSPSAASAEAVRLVGPACALTSLTTMIAFLSLGIFGGVEIIQRLGIACAGGSVLVFVSVLVMVPLLAAGRMGVWMRAPERPTLTAGLSALDRFIARHSRALTGCAIAVTLALALVCTLLRIDYRYVEHIPDSNAAARALAISDEKFGGAIPIRVLLRWPEGQDLVSPEGRAVLERIHAILEESEAVRSPVSLLNVLRSLPAGWDYAARRRAIEGLEPEVIERLVDFEGRHAIVSAYVVDRGAAALSPLFDVIEKRLATLAAATPGYEAELTGLLVTTTRLSRSTIWELTFGLAVAAICIFVVMGLALRSLSLGLIGILPNLFPFIATAACMALTGIPLQYTSVLAFTICIGIAADDTAHYLFRFQRARAEDGAVDRAVSQATRSVGTALVITTLILASGLIVLLLSALPNLRIFGWTSTAAIFFALLGDLLFLPALLLTFLKAGAARAGATQR